MGAKKADKGKRDISSCDVKPRLVDVDALFGKRTIPEIKKGLEKGGIEKIKVGVFDVDGILRGKYLSTSKFLSALDNGFGFCDVVLGWDSNDQLYDKAKFTGWHTAYPDALVRVIPETIFLKWSSEVRAASISAIVFRASRASFSLSIRKGWII